MLVLYGVPRRAATAIRIANLTERLTCVKIKNVYTELWPENKLVKLLVVIYNVLRLLNPFLKYDYLYCTPSIISSGFPAIAAKIFRRFTLVADWDDSFYDFATIHPKINQASYWEVNCIKKADIVLVVSKTLETSAKRMGKTKVVYIPNGVDTQLFDPSKYIHDRPLFREKYGIKEDDVVVGFVGSMPQLSNGHIVGTELFPIMDIAPNIRLMIVGAGKGFDVLKKTIETSPYKQQLIFVDYVDHPFLPRVLSTMDIGVVPLDIDSYSALTRSSFKMKDFMSMNMTIVSINIGESNVDLGGGHYGVLVENNDKIPEAVKYIIANNLRFTPREKAIDYEFDKIANDFDVFLRDAHSIQRG